MEDLALHGGVVARKSPLHPHDVPGGGADIPDRFKPYMEDENTTVVSRHVTYAPTSDLAYLLRRRKIETVIMAGPVANLCLEDHMRNLIRDGFETVMVRDAVAAAANEEGSGLDAAMINWRFMANAVWTTEETVRRMAEAAKATVWNRPGPRGPFAKKRPSNVARRRGLRVALLTQHHPQPGTTNFSTAGDSNE